MFVSGGSSQQIADTGNAVRDILGRILSQTEIVALADRDDKTPRKSTNSKVSFFPNVT